MKKSIAIAGNIGSGKSTLVEFLSNNFDISPFYEPNASNPRSKSGRNRQGAGSKSRKGRSRKKQPRHDPRKFWGDMEQLPTPEGFDTDSQEPLAVVHSLGRAPLQGVTAEPYFAAVYDRAAGLASVLSDAAGLDDLAPVEPEPDDGADGDSDPS